LSSLPTNIGWALAKNPEITKILCAKYELGHGYWKYLDGLVGELRSANCKGIQQKVVDVANNPKKFESMVSEFEIARLLTRRDKQVEMLPDDFLAQRASPDMHVADSFGEYYVEVVRFSEDAVVGIILDELRRLLNNPSRPFQVNVVLSNDLSIPVIDHTERSIKEGKAKAIMAKFEEALPSIQPTRLPTSITIDGVVFHISKSPIGRGFAGFINGQVIVLPSQKFVCRIRFLVADPEYGKAVKRTTWSDDHLKKRYIVAIDCEQDVEEEDLDEALLGKRASYELVPPNVLIPQEVKDAAKKNWTIFLEGIHMLPKGKTIFTSYGVYLTSPLCKNVSGVLLHVRLGSEVFFVPNPFADDLINDSRLTGFYP
jgi:hypothetical protein